MQLDYFSVYAEANIVCIIILGILLFHGRKNGTRQEKQIWYDRTIIAHVLYFLSDIGWAGVFSGRFPQTRFMILLFNLLNYVLLGMLAYEWFMYMAASIRLAFLKEQKKRAVCLIPIAVSVLAVMIVYAVSPDFLIGEDGLPVTGYYLMMILAPIVYLISAFVFSMIRARKTESREEAFLFRLIGIYPLGIMVFGLIQTFTTDLPLFCFGCAIMMLFFYIQNLQTLVSVDSLTRLNNRGQINRYMGQSRYRENTKTYAMMMDIDNFKHINDTYGHAEGDRALILVSEVLKQAAEKTRSAVFIGRYGGDEFSVFLFCSENDVQPDQFLETLRMLLRERQQKEQLPYPLNISAGYDLLQDKNDTLAATLNRADRKLYEYKRAAKIGR